MAGRVLPGAGAGLRQMILDVGPDAAVPESGSGSPLFNMTDVDSAFMFLRKKAGDDLHPQPR